MLMTFDNEEVFQSEEEIEKELRRLVDRVKVKAAASQLDEDETVQALMRLEDLEGSTESPVCKKVLGNLLDRFALEL